MTALKKGDTVNTSFGMVKVIEIDKRKITVLIDGDITATFNRLEFEGFIL